MTLRQGNREQMQYLPPSIEQYIPEDAPTRVYDAFVETLDLKELGIKYGNMILGHFPNPFVNICIVFVAFLHNINH